MRFQSKKVLAKEVAHQFVERVRRQISESNRIEKEAEDVEKIDIHIKTSQLHQKVLHQN